MLNSTKASTPKMQQSKALHVHMKIILLPGLDGTGILFEKLLEEIPSVFDVEVVSYDSIKAVSYSSQAIEIAERFKHEDIFIVGESYSGRVVYELCQILGGHVKGVVFLASFISRPSAMSRVASIMPLGLLKPNRLSRFMLYLFGFNMAGGPEVVAPVFQSLQKTDKRKLKLRLSNIAHLAKPTEKIDCPVTYIRPSTDLLVGINSVKYLASMCSNFSRAKVNGGHFIAQSNPVVCAKVICNAVNM